jgi:hypothetical protein
MSQGLAFAVEESWGTLLRWILKSPSSMVQAISTRRSIKESDLPFLAAFPLPFPFVLGFESSEASEPRYGDSERPWSPPDLLDCKKMCQERIKNLPLT